MQVDRPCVLRVGAGGVWIQMLTGRLVALLGALCAAMRCATRQDPLWHSVRVWTRDRCWPLGLNSDCVGAASLRRDDCAPHFQVHPTPIAPSPPCRQCGLQLQTHRCRPSAPAQTSPPRSAGSGLRTAFGSHRASLCRSPAGARARVSVRVDAGGGWGITPPHRGCCEPARYTGPQCQFSGSRRTMAAAHSLPHATSAVSVTGTFCG